MSDHLLTPQEKANPTVTPLRSTTQASTGASRGAPHSVLQLQRAVGNRLVSQLIQRRRLAPTGLMTAPRVARKWQEDLEGWGSPLVGHDDSDVTYTPSGDFRTAGFASDMAALANEDFLAQYYREQVGLKEGEYAHSEMVDSSRQPPASGTLQIKAGRKGTVEITIKAHFFMDEKSNDTYDTEFAGIWEVEADLQGNLKFVTDGLTRGGLVNDSEAPFQMTALDASKVDGNPATVMLKWAFVSYQFTDVPNVQIGGEIEVGKGGKGGLGGNITLGNEQTYPAGRLPGAAFLRLQVVDIPPPPPPPEAKGTVTFGPMSMLREWDVLFPAPKNRKGQFEVSPAQEKKLVAWFQGLNSTTREKIIDGSIPLSLEGHASTTGENNLELSKKRMEKVMNILATFAGDRAKFMTRSAGEYEAQTEDEVESQDERRVHISVWEQISEGETTPGGGKTP